MAKSETKAKDVHGDALEATRSRETLTKAQRAEVFRAAKGKCFVTGAQVDPFDRWSVVDGKLVSEAVAKDRRSGESMQDFRLRITDELREAKAKVERYGALLPNDGSTLMRFAGEDRQATIAAPAELEMEAAGIR